VNPEGDKMTRNYIPNREIMLKLWPKGCTNIYEMHSFSFWIGNSAHLVPSGLAVQQCDTVG